VRPASQVAAVSQAEPETGSLEIEYVRPAERRAEALAATFGAHDAASPFRAAATEAALRRVCAAVGTQSVCDDLLIGREPETTRAAALLAGLDTTDLPATERKEP